MEQPGRLPGTVLAGLIAAPATGGGCVAAGKKGHGGSLRPALRPEVVHLSATNQSDPAASCPGCRPVPSCLRTPWVLDLDGLGRVQQVSLAPRPPAFLCRKQWKKTGSFELRKTGEQKVKCKSRAARLETTIFVAAEN